MASSDQPNNAVPLNEQNVTDTSNVAHWIALAFVLGFVSLGPSGVLQVKSDLLHTCFKSLYLFVYAYSQDMYILMTSICIFS